MRCFAAALIALVSTVLLALAISAFLPMSPDVVVFHMLLIAFFAVWIVADRLLESKKGSSVLV